MFSGLIERFGQGPMLLFSCFYVIQPVGRLQIDVVLVVPRTNSRSPGVVTVAVSS